MNTAKATPNPARVTMPPLCAIMEAAPPVDCSAAAVLVEVADEFLLVPEPLPPVVEVLLLLPPLVVPVVDPVEEVLLLLPLVAPVEETSVCEAR